ncbi:FG-GAP repeat domain-containing protein [Streptomyces sp. NPDC059991]|uniref:FG-GAP repeat domain-containing protein n=1 Tax=Streptomyces sp. NPDC059991 TaxID=3347028 RepID=UPI0036BCD118
MAFASHAAADSPAPQPAPRALPRADFDGNGLGDVFFRTAAGHLYVSESGRPAYGPGDFFNERDHPEWNFYKDIIPIGDLSGDGLADFLTLSAQGRLDLVRSYRDNSANGITWSGGGWQTYNKVFSPGDVNGDHKADLLARTPDGDLYLYLATGDLASPFTPRVKVGSGWQRYDQLVGLSDNNGDGIGDLLARTPQGDLYFYAGTGDPTHPFQAPARVGGGWNTYNQLAGGDDMTGDGTSDIVARTPSGVLYLYQGDGHGNFTARTLDNRGFRWEQADLIATAGGTPAFGKPKILARDTRGALYSYQALGNGQLAARHPEPRLYRCGTSLSTLIGYASDLAADGQPDTLSVCGWGQLFGGSEGQNPMGSGGWDAYTVLTGPGDLTGDGKADLLARDKSGVLYLYRGDGTVDFPGLYPRIRIGGGWNTYDKILGAGDYTGDGRADIVARTPSGTLYLYEGTGSATAPFKTRVKIGDGWQQYTQLAAIGDIDGDGKGDLVAANSRGDLYRYSATGTGTFQPRVKLGGGWNTYHDLY